MPCHIKPTEFISLIFYHHVAENNKQKKWGTLGYFKFCGKTSTTANAGEKTVCPSPFTIPKTQNHEPNPKFK